MSKTTSKDNLQKLSLLIQGAFDSTPNTDCKRIDRIIRDAGFLHPGRARGKDTAAFFGVSKGRVTQWVSEGCPRNQDRTYDLTSVYKWRVEKETEDRAQAKLESMAAGTDMEAWVGSGSPALEEMRREKAKEYKRKNRIAEGSLIEIEEVVGMLSAWAVAYRAKVEALANVYGQEIIKEMEEVLEKLEENKNNYADKISENS